VAGQVLDRQGRPVGGARIFLQPGERSAVTDVQGRFDMRNILPDKAFVLVQQPGFRFQGWPVDRATQAGELRLTLVRMNEVPDREMTALAEPINLDEARALADQVLEPYLQQALAKGAAIYRPPVLEALSTFNLDRALELFKQGMLEDEPSSNRLREHLARVMAESDPAGAEALVEAISESTRRARCLLALSAALPASKRDQKRQILEKVVPLVRCMPDPDKVHQIAALAEAWLDLGEVERARQFLLESLERCDALPDSLPNGRFLAQLSRVEPELALARIRKIADPDLRDASFENVAMVLAIDHPAEAERFFNLRSLIPKTSESRGFTASAIVAKACLDPQAAVALLDALPAAQGLGPSEPANQARIYLAEALGQPPEKRWVARWRQLSEFPLDD
jgi:tetratricopeptide (TPR) repeat protein